MKIVDGLIVTIAEVHEMVKENKELINSVRDDLLDIINTLLRDPNTSSAMNMAIDRLPTKKRVDVLELLRSRSNNQPSNKMSYKNFSFSISNFEIIILLTSLIIAVIELPNMGVRVANLLRDKFSVSHDFQLRLVRLIDIVSNVAPKAMAGLVTLNNIISSQSKDVISNAIKGPRKDSWKNPFAYRDWLASLNTLYGNKSTRGYVVEAINELDNPVDKYIAKELLRLLGHTVNFSDIKGSYVNYARIMITRTKNSVSGTDNLEYGNRKITPFDIVRVITHIIINVLSNPGVGLVVSNLLKRNLSLSTFNALLIGTGVTTTAAITKSVLDRVQKIKDATYGMI